jgi:hypothetical protein
MMKSAVLAKEETKQVVQQLKRMEKGPEPTFRIKTHVSRMKPVDGTALSSTLPQEIPIEEVKQIGALQMSSITTTAMLQPLMRRLLPTQAPSFGTFQFLLILLL